MAGWHNWNGIQVSTGASVARTILETVWPTVGAIAHEDQWPEHVWVNRMLSTLSEAVCVAKQTESVVLQQDQDMQNAVKAGEMFASNRFHQAVCRFETAEEAEDWLMRIVMAHPPAHRNIPAQYLEAAPQGEIRQAMENLAAPPNNQGVRVAWQNIAFDHYVRWLYYTKVDDESATNVANALIAYVAGMCKMGNMSRAWMTSRIRQIRREAQNADLELTREVVEKVWDFYGAAFAPLADQFGPFFVYIEERCRAHHMTRLFVTAQQSAEQGCTVLNVIAEAQKQCDDFNWERFRQPRVPAERAIQAELRIWGTEFEAMKINPWIRFAGVSGRSPEMANLGYLAKQLLTKGMGQNSLLNYEGLDMGNLTVRHKAWIDRVVQQYVDHLNTPPAGVVEHPVARPAGVNMVRHRRLLQAPIRPAALDFENAAPVQRPNAAAAAGRGRGGGRGGRGGGNAGAGAGRGAAGGAAQAVNVLANAPAEQQQNIFNLIAQLAQLQANPNANFRDAGNFLDIHDVEVGDVGAIIPPAAQVPPVGQQQRQQQVQQAPNQQPPAAGAVADGAGGGAGVRNAQLDEFDEIVENP